MKRILKESEHLVRLALVLAAGIAIFLAIRQAVVPAHFGQYGHYRPGSLDDIRARPIAFAGHEACEMCHDDVAKTKNQGKHAQVACEACHGPLAKHADDPTATPGYKPEARPLCVRCHQADLAKPKAFPQVVPQEHAGEMSCTECHNPHHPEL